MSNGFYEGEGAHKNLYIYIMEKGGEANFIHCRFGLCNLACIFYNISFFYLIALVTYCFALNGTKWQKPFRVLLLHIIPIIVNGSYNSLLVGSQFSCKIAGFFTHLSSGSRIFRGRQPQG